VVAVVSVVVGAVAVVSVVVAASFVLSPPHPARAMAPAATAASINATFIDSPLVGRAQAAARRGLRP
jgi:hypothetical protein